MTIKKLGTLSFSLLLLPAALIAAVDTSSAPGVAIAHQDTRYDLFYTTPRVFISDPEILILSNGDYLASHALAGRSSESGTSGKTTVYRSTDSGLSWSKVTEITGLLRASLLEHNGAVYLIGSNHDASGSKAVIARSNDYGATWTKSAVFSKGGSATPNNPVVFKGRIWNAATTSSFSALATAPDLLQDSAWTNKGGFPALDPNWPGGKNSFVGEGQIVASPEHGLYILPKVKFVPLTALARVDSTTGAVAFDPARDFISLPGGEKKIGAGYDPVSGRFYALTQPILPAHSGSSIATDMIRNSAAILSSKDLFNWKVESFIVYSSRIDTDGFGYMNFDIDGNDMVLVARTAWPVTGTSYNPKRGHDSNLLTFHRLANFRTIAPDFYLTISSGAIKRFERTADPRDHDLPHGNFAQGNSFASAPLTSPNGFGKAANGDVYVRESAGRMLRFDALGNFIETVSSAPVTWQSSALSIDPPARGECGWVRSGSGEWSDPLNWHYWGRPGTDEDIAVFGSAAASPATVTVPTRSHEWLFNTNGDLEGWTGTNIDALSVANGTLSGQPTTVDPYIVRAGQSFFAEESPEIRVRMRANTTAFNLQFYWITAAHAGFTGTKVVTANYSGNGQFQDVVFRPAGHALWDGQLITSIRIDPINGTTTPFEIDSITVQKIPTRLKGLRFNHNLAYTLAGSGCIELKADQGRSLVEVQLGQHAVNIPVALANESDFISAPGATLQFSAGLDLAGNTLSASGHGLVIVNSFTMSSGKLAIEAGSTVTINRNVVDYNGTLECYAPVGFAPSAGNTFHLLEFSGALSGTFNSVVLPALPDGLGWDTSTLYSAGSIAVVLRAPAAWLSAHNLPIDGSADFLDSDGDGMDNYSEWKAGTDPRDSNSRFLVSNVPAEPVANGFKLRWNTLTGRFYRVERSTNLLDTPPFQPLRSGIPGINGIFEFTDPSFELHPSAFYRIVIE